MKKLVLISILIISLLSLASAVEIRLTKEIYSPNELLQAEIYGNFIDGIELKNIYFYRERNIPVIYDISKSEGKYLLYALLPSKEGNYTLKIKNTRYETDTGTSTEDIIKEFKVQTGNETTLTINPGFLITREDFHIQVEASENIEVEVEFLEEKQTISLTQNKEEKIYFSIEGVENYTETNIKINDYLIPVFIFPKNTQIVVTSETSKFRFNPLEIDATILEDESYFFQVSIVNFGRNNINIIKLSSNLSDKLNIEIVPDFISEIEAGKEKFVNLTLSPEKDGTFLGTIFADSENLSAELEVNIEVTLNKSDVGYEWPAFTGDGTCAEAEGRVCPVEEKCSVPLELATDGYCCKGECIARDTGSGSWVYGVVIIIVVILGVLVLALFMRKKQRKSINILKQRQENYEKRMKGEEVRGKLART